MKNVEIISVQFSDQYDEARKNGALVYSLSSNPEFSGTEQEMLAELSPSEVLRGRITWGVRTENDGVDYIGDVNIEHKDMYYVIGEWTNEPMNIQSFHETREEAEKKAKEISDDQSKYVVKVDDGGRKYLASEMSYDEEVDFYGSETAYKMTN